MMKAWLCVGMLFAVGCHKEPKVVDQPPTENPSPATSEERDPAKRAEQSRLMAPVMAQLEREKQNRPAGTPTAEQVFSAVESAGIKLKTPQQVIGGTNKAHFCEMVMTTNALGMSVCEYDDEKGPAAGREASQKNFKDFNRDWFINKKTLLTMNQMNKTPECKAEHDKIAALFPTLTAPK